MLPKPPSLALVLAALALPAAPAAAAPFVEGKHYTVVAEEASAEPEVMEFFSYGCGGCFVFDPYFKQVKAAVGESAEVKYVPADFGGGFWTPAQELFLVMEALGRREELHDAAFRFIHGERNPITESSARAFMERHGVSREEYDKLRNSFAVHVKEKRYDQLTQRFRIGSTPTVIVNGKYKVEQKTLEDADQLVRLVKYLLQNP